MAKKNSISDNHCYQVNDCSSMILVIKGGANFLRHCQPYSNRIFLSIKGGTIFDRFLQQTSSS